MRATAFAVLTFLTLPTAAGAASFTPPEGCKLDMTVQSRGCIVANYYRCDADNPGDRWAAFADREGVFNVSKVDAETRWMESFSPVTGVGDRLIPDAHDHASLTTLLATGRDDFDFAVVDTTGTLTRHKGFDELTGEVQRLDGVTLEVTRFEVRAYDAGGALLFTREGQQYVSRNERLFFGGAETFTEPGKTPISTLEDPMSFARPGEAGFGDAKPQYDCDLLMTARPAGSAG